MSTPTVQLTIDSDNIALVVSDMPAKSVNTLAKKVWDDLESAISSLEQRDGLRGVIVASGKPKSFIAGADLFEMKAMDRGQLEQYLLFGQEVLNRLAMLPAHSCAAINGDALGGGLEVALACTFRVAIDEPQIKIGLPETTIGLIPGWGGTVRLPRLIGLEKALPLMVQGRPLAPKAAKDVGLVDELATRDDLIATAKRVLLEKRAVPRFAGDTDAAARNALFDKTRNDQIKRFGRHYPAPLRLIDVVQAGYDKSISAGFDGERVGLCDMRETESGRNLMRVFFLRTGAKKAIASKLNATPKQVRNAVVVGGGTMGSGIAMAMARAGINVRVIESTQASADRVMGRLRDTIANDVAGGGIDEATSQKLLERLLVNDSYSDLAATDLAVEAVVEDLEVKKSVLGKLENAVSKDCILASNTSSLSLTAMAESTKDPSRFVGLHFFNPVAKMPLVEVGTTRHASPVAVATAVAVAQSCGKTPVLVKDSPGLLVNRVLFPQLHAALKLAESGQSIPAMDKAIKNWGMPMGSFELMDEIGLDVTLFILNALTRELGDRFSPPKFLETLVRDGHVGNKAGKGFYVRSKERGAPPLLNDAAVKLLPPPAETQLSEEMIQNQLMLPMAREAKMTLEEGIVDSIDTIDIATLLGLGFAQFRGGLGTWMQTVDDGPH